jgi:hypothetical protein
VKYLRQTDDDRPVYRCEVCGAEVATRGDPEASHQCRQFPSLPSMAWNLTKAVAGFVADGCRLLTGEQYDARMAVCRSCEFFAADSRRCRHNDCGCFLAAKARMRSEQCPENKWPEVTDAH